MVLFFPGSCFSLSLALEALIDAVRHLLLASLTLCFFVFPGLPLPQILLDPASPHNIITTGKHTALFWGLPFTQTLVGPATQPHQHDAALPHSTIRKDH